MEEFKWCIKLDSQEAVDYANKHGTLAPYSISCIYAHFPSYHGATVWLDVKPGYKELTLSQFKSQVLNQPETLPEFWVVFNNGEPDFQKVIGYLFEKHGYKWDGNLRIFYGFDGNEYQNGTCSRSEIEYFDNNPVILLLEEFIQLTEKKMEQEIIGYKLVKTEYREAALIICDVQSFINTNGCDFSINSHSHNRIKEAGVLDLWFEKVYKPEIKLYTMGEPGNTFEVIVRDGKVFYKDVDITENVEGIQSILRPLYIRFTIHDAKVSILGFNNRQASFSQWLSIKL